LFLYKTKPTPLEIIKNLAFSKKRLHKIIKLCPPSFSHVKEELPITDIETMSKKNPKQTKKSKFLHLILHKEKKEKKIYIEINK